MLTMQALFDGFYISLTVLIRASSYKGLAATVNSRFCSRRRFTGILQDALYLICRTGERSNWVAVRAGTTIGAVGIEAMATGATVVRRLNRDAGAGG
jgi:hypothetical protein